MVGKYELAPYSYVKLTFWKNPELKIGLKKIHYFIILIN